MKVLMKMKREKEAKADSFHIKAMKRYGLIKLRNAIDISAYETELEIAELSKDAYAFNEFQLKNKVVCSLFSHMVNEKKA